MAQAPANLHQGSSTTGLGGGADLDISAMIDRDTCASAYMELLEVCLGENDRKWSLCQKEVKLLKLCKESELKKK